MRIFAYLPAILAAGTSGCAAGVQDTGFDFQHASAALEYFEDKDDARVASIAHLTATSHLRKHADFSGYFGSEVSPTEMTRSLLERVPTSQEIAQTQALIDYVKAHPERQSECVTEANRYLPQSVGRDTRIFATWGYDIGVASTVGASINFAHPRFRKSPEEVWFYCAHEAHHAGVFRIHEFPPLKQVQTVEALLGLIRYATFLEGSAVFAAQNIRAAANALDQDEDYRALADQERMDAISARFDEIIATLGKRDPSDGLDERDWALIDEMSSGERIWYRHGARMAAAIFSKYGADKFVAIIADGPSAFFHAYSELSDDNLPE